MHIYVTCVCSDLTSVMTLSRSEIFDTNCVNQGSKTNVFLMMFFLRLIVYRSNTGSIRASRMLTLFEIICPIVMT